MSAILQRNNVTIQGSGDQSIVLLHGFGCDKSMWNYILPAFTHKYKIVLYDLIGFGNSRISEWVDEKHGRLEGHAEDLLEICEELNLNKPIFIGHSVSSMIGGLADVKRPGYFKQLIMIGPSPRYINDGDYCGGFEQKDIDDMLEMLQQNYILWSQSMAPAIMGNTDDPEHGEILTESFCKSDPEMAYRFAHLTFTSDNRSDLKNITADTLIIQCNEDIISSRSVGEYVHKNIANSKFVLMEAKGHCPHVSYPEETIEKIENFLGV